MSRSYRKPFQIVTKQWDQEKEKRYRRHINQELQYWDPDKDWEELNLSQKHFEEYGTKIGFPNPPSETEDLERYNEFKRK